MKTAENVKITPGKWVLKGITPWKCWKHVFRGGVSRFGGGYTPDGASCCTTFGGGWLGVYRKWGWGGTPILRQNLKKWQHESYGQKYGGGGGGGYC